MNLIKAVILGIIQGLTEWLPVSSSGHLVIVQHYLGEDAQEMLLFDAMVHFATAFVVLFVFRATILKILKGLFSKKSDTESLNYRKMGHLLIVGSIPTAIMGILFKDYFEETFGDVLIVGFMLLITGSILFPTDSKRFKKGKKIEKMSVKDSLFIGFMQGLAITPGISRSGFTISAGIFRGIDRRFAAEFSFLLAVPAIIGAASVELVGSFGEEIEIPIIAAGMITAALVGYLSLLLLMESVKRRGFRIFSYYCWVVGSLVIVHSLLF